MINSVSLGYLAKSSLALILFQSLFCCSDCFGILYMTGGVPGDTVIATVNGPTNGIELGECNRVGQFSSVANVYPDGTTNVYNMIDAAYYGAVSPITGSSGNGSIPGCQNGSLRLGGGGKIIRPGSAQDFGDTVTGNIAGPETLDGGPATISASTTSTYQPGYGYDVETISGSCVWSSFGSGLTTRQVSLTVPYVAQVSGLNSPLKVVTISLSLNGGQSWTVIKQDYVGSGLVGTASAGIAVGTDLSSIAVKVSLPLENVSYSELL